VRAIERPAPWAVADRVATGVGLAWIVTPFLVLLAALVRGSEGGWLVPALLTLGLAAATGYVVGLGSLGWLALAAAGAGAMVELALPYLLVPPLLGLSIWGVDVYGGYAPVAAGTVVAAIAGCWAGIRGATGLTLPARLILTAGLVVLVTWFGIWLVMGRSIGVAA
jgi:hypothetical protein